MNLRAAFSQVTITTQIQIDSQFLRLPELRIQESRLLRIDHLQICHI